MQIATIGRGKIGGGLGKLWEGAGHEVTMLGHEGGDVSEADVVLVAAPGPAIAEALDSVTGLEGKLAIDATNLVGTTAPEGFSSNAEYVKSRTGGPTAKSFNINFAAIYDQLGQTEKPPSNLWCGDEEAREAVERLNRDAGFDPVYAGPLGNAVLQERFIDLVFAINKTGMGPFFYRIAPPDRL